MEFGEQYVMMIGTHKMLWWFADSLAIRSKVCIHCTSEVHIMDRVCGLISGAEAIQQAFFGQGTGRIIFDDVGCTGSESTLASCPLSRTHNCAHSEDAGVRCQPGTINSPYSLLYLMQYLM